MHPAIVLRAASLLLCSVAAAQTAYWSFDHPTQPFTDLVHGLVGQPSGAGVAISSVSLAPVAGNVAGLRVNGVDRLTVASDPALNLFPNSPLSILLWIQPTGTAVPSVFHVFGKRTGCAASTAIEYQLARDPTQGFHFGASSNGFRVRLGANNSTADLPLNTWSHVAITWTGLPAAGPGTLSLYLNGQLANAVSVSVGTLAPPSTSPFVIDGSGTCGGGFTGNLDELRYYNTVLSPAQIAQVAAHGTTATFTAFGTGCPGAGGIPILSQQAGSLPRLGQTFQLSLTNLPLTTSPIGVLGFSTTSNSSGLGVYALPHDLGALGMPGCAQLVSEEGLTILQATNGQVVWQVVIPADAALTGVTFHVQALVPEGGVNVFGATVTNGGTGVVG